MPHHGEGVAAAAGYARILSNSGWGAYSRPGAGSTTFNASGRVHLVPINVPFPCTVDLLGYIIGTVAVGNVRIGLYNYGSYGFPDLPDDAPVVVESASVAQLGLATRRLHWIDVVDTLLAPGLYFVALQGDDPTGTCYVLVETFNWVHNALGNVNPGRRYDHVYGPLTDPCPVTVGYVNKPCVYMRVVQV